MTTQSTKPFLITFLGVPGSGKSTFARAFAQKIAAVTLDSDAIRLSMWGSQSAVWAAHADPGERASYNALTFGAIDYAARQILSAGHSVIYDCNANTVAERTKIASIAEQHDAQFLAVWIQTPHQVAIARIEKRNQTRADSSKNPESPSDVVSRFAREIEAPDAHEFAIAVSGELPFDEQYRLVYQKMTELMGSI